MPNKKSWSEKEKSELRELVKTKSEAELEFYFRRCFPQIHMEMKRQGLQFPSYYKLKAEREERRVQFKAHISNPKNYKNFIADCKYYAIKRGIASKSEDFIGWALEQGLKGNVVWLKYLSLRFRHLEKKHDALEFDDKRYNDTSNE